MTLGLDLWGAYLVSHAQHLTAQPLLRVCSAILLPPIVTILSFHLRSPSLDGFESEAEEEVSHPPTGVAVGRCARRVAGQSRGSRSVQTT